MNSVNVSSSSKKALIITLILLLVGGPLLFYLVSQQQIFQQFAWSTKQSASAACNQTGNIDITVSFSNTEASKDMDVVAKDLQTGTEIDMGTVTHGETKEAVIDTNIPELEAGSVLFTLTWTDGRNGTDTRSAKYKKTDACPPPAPYCPENPEEKGVCRWDPLEGADSYDVEVIATESGDIVATETVSGETTELAFDMVPGVSYQCNVSSINACGTGEKASSPEKICTIPTPTPTPPPVCPDEPLKQGVCEWDALDGATEYHVIVKDETGDTIVKEETVKETKLVYEADPEKTYTCSVTAINKCSESPPIVSTPVTCSIPSPTPSTVPTLTTTPIPSQPTPTKPVPTPTVPAATPTTPPTPTIIVLTATPNPTPTPKVIVRIPPNRQPPVQQPPQGVPPVVQQPPAVVQQPPVQQQTIPQQPTPTLAPGQPTPVPTIPPTGALSDSLILVGSSVLLVLIGGLLLFAL